MINVQLLELPFTVKGVTVKNDDGSYTLIINSALNYEQQLNAYIHEMKHIKQRDFEKNNVCKIENSIRR